MDGIYLKSAMSTSTSTLYESIWKHLSKVQFQHRWINVGGVNTRYIQAGSPNSRTLIMLPGTAGSLERFCANLAELSKSFNCYAFDLLEAGLTDKPDKDYEIADYVEHVSEFMVQVGVSKASLIGVSLGTWVAARFALQYPEKVERLIFNAPFGYADDAEEIAGIRTRRGKAFDEPSWDDVRTIFDHLIYLPSKRIPDLIRLRQAMYLEPGAKEASHHILNLFQPEILQRNLISAEEWKQIQQPTMVVMSLKDRPLFLKTALAISTLIPKAVLLEMDDVGHWPQFEDPDYFNAKAIEFLSG